MKIKFCEHSEKRGLHDGKMYQSPKSKVITQSHKDNWRAVLQSICLKGGERHRGTIREDSNTQAYVLTVELLPPLDPREEWFRNPREF